MTIDDVLEELYKRISLAENKIDEADIDDQTAYWEGVIDATNGAIALINGDEELIPCNNCQGNGCTKCGGSGHF